jgi:hypothetical protein
VTLLNAKFSLLGIADVEAFTGRIVERSGLRLSAQDREELHVWLIEECWSLSTCYRPGRLAFAAFADGRFRLRVVDWQRARWGRTRWTFSGREYTGSSTARPPRRFRPRSTGRSSRRKPRGR